MEEYEIDLRDYVRVIWEKKWVVAAVFMAAVLVALVISLVLPPQYQTETKLLITPSLSERLSTTEKEGASSPSLVETTLSAEIYKSLALANDLLKSVIDALNAAGSNKFSIESLKEMMKPSVQKDERFPLLVMNVKGSNPQQIKAISDTWAELFIERNAELLSTTTAQSFEFIAQQFEGVRKSLIAKEEEQVRYKQQNPLETLESELKVLKAKYEDFLSRLQSKRLELIEKSAKLSSLEVALKNEPQFLEVQGSISRDTLFLLLGLNPKQEHLEDLPKLTFTDQLLNGLYTSLKDQLNEAGVAVGTLQQEVGYLAEKTSEFRKEIEAKAAKTVEIKLALEQFDREISILKETFKFLSGKLQEARIAKEERLKSIKVVEAAVVPEVPIGPDKGLNVLIAGVLGLFVGVLAAFFWRYLESAQGSLKPEVEPR